MKRLLFPYVPDSSESLIGAFAGALHDHRIRSMRTGIEGAGFSLSRPGSLQMATDEQIVAVAHLMRCDAAVLKSIAIAQTDARARVALGDLELPRAIFDLERRRIAPGELLRRPFHRGDWLNLLLPYCPQSLELLIDACADCGPLGWTITRGVAACENCGEVVPPSDAADLERELVEPYRFAAELMSRSGTVGATAKSRLPEAIQAFSRSALCDVMLRAGIVLGLRRSGNALVDVLAKPAAEIATVIAAGARLIAGWPRSAREEFRAKTDDMGGDLTGYERLRGDLRWIGRGSPEAGRLVTLAFPTLDGRTANPFAGEKRYYTATQTNGKLWTTSSELERLRRAEVIDFEELPSNRRLRARYDADGVDELRAALDEGISLGTAASELDVPVYALGQLVETGRLEISGTAGVRLLRGVQIKRRSVDALISELRKHVSDRQPAPVYVPLRRILAGYPGEKPWAECVELMLVHEVTLFLTGSIFSIRDLLLDPADLPEPVRTETAIDRDPTGIARIPLRDAYEVLGAVDEEAMVAIRGAKLEVVTEGRGKSVCRHGLERLASEIAFSGEVALHEGASPIATFHSLSRLGISRQHGAWSRPELVARGMVRPHKKRRKASTAESL